MMPPPVATVAGAFMIADDSSESDYAMFVYSNTVHYLYNHKEDDWIQIPSGAFPVALAAGACGTYHPWSVTFTANGGSTSTITVASATHNIVGYVKGKTVEFLTGTAGNIGLRRTITDIYTNSGTGTITLYLDSPVTSPVATSDTFRINSGSFFVLWNGTLVVNTYFRRFDMATQAWSGMAIANLAATWGTDGKLVSPYIGNVAYDSGTATSGSSTNLVVSGRTWTVDQWKNYQVRITSGTGRGQIRVITANDATTLTFAAGAVIDNTSTFIIEGDENAIYALGNNAVTLYKYSISANTWATVSVTAARAGAPIAGMTATFVGQTGNSNWADKSSIKDGRYIYSLRGGTAVIDRYDIATLAWLPTTGVVYTGQTTFATGSSAFWSDEHLYLAKEGTAAIPQRFYKYNVCKNTIEPITTDWYLGGAALLGNKIWIKKLSSEGKVKWLYCLQSTTQNLRRIMLF